MSGLMVLKERIDATEALIAIDLDNRRNELVAFDLVSDSQSNFAALPQECCQGCGAWHLKLQLCSHIRHDARGPLKLPHSDDINAH